MSSHPSLRLGALLLLAAAGAAPLGAFAGGNQFLQRNLVANTDAYAPQIVDPTLINAWGIAIRPAGLGGHFWVTANTTGVSTQWVGDVGTFPLYQDDLRFVSVPGPTLGPGVTPSQPIIQPGTPTGVVFNGGSDFVVTQGSITAPAKFIFSTDNGVISGWTERRNPDGSFDRPHDAVTTIDRSADGTQFFGVGLDATGGRLYAANFGENPGMQIYDGTWSDITASYAGTDLGMNPFVTDGYQPFNVQALDDRLFVAYAKYGTPGEEETGDGLGRVAEFTFDGALVRTWGDGTGLNAPWGVAIAPEGFGDFGGHLLVSNFGDGTIAAFDPDTLAFVDFLRDAGGDVIAIEGIWGLQFGNGESLGEAHRLYFAAGPEDETAGLFGSLEVHPVPEPSTWAALAIGLGLLGPAAARASRRARARGVTASR
jgi:uncharacterized protein (TIGR03118 family)